MADFNFLRTFPVDLSRYLPDFLYDDDGFTRVQKALGDEHEKQRQWAVETEKQLFVNTATWGLTDWEEFVGIRTDTSRDIALRRRDILVKLAAPASVTPAWLTDLANRFLRNPSAEVIPHNEEYWFEVWFDLDDLLSWGDLRAAIKLYKPAHLGLDMILGIILPLPVHHKCLCMQYVDARHIVWNLGMANKLCWDGAYTFDGIPVWAGWLADAQGRDRQHHAIMIDIAVDLNQSAMLRHVPMSWLVFAASYTILIGLSAECISVNTPELHILRHYVSKIKGTSGTTQNTPGIRRNQMDGKNTVWDGMHAFDGEQIAKRPADHACVCFDIDKTGRIKEGSFTRL